MPYIMFPFYYTDLNAGMSNYELLNNVPPNVSLQRSTNVAAESQLSPGFSPNLMQQQLSPNQRAPFSPQSNQGEAHSSNHVNLHFDFELKLYLSTQSHS